MQNFPHFCCPNEKVAPCSREAHRHYWSGRFCQREPCRTSPAVSCSSSSVGSKARGTILSSGPSLFAFIWAPCSGRMSLRGGGGGGSSVEDSLGGGGLHERMMDSRACRLSYMGLLKLVGHVGSWRDPTAPSTVTCKSGQPSQNALTISHRTILKLTRLMRLETGKSNIKTTIICQTHSKDTLL